MIIDKMVKGLKDLLGSPKKDLADFTVIGRNTEVDGVIISDNIFLEGVYRPTNTRKFSKLQISKTGSYISVNEDDFTEVELLEVAGTFRGNVIATKVILHEGADIVGTVKYTVDFISNKNVTIIGNIQKI